MRDLSRGVFRENPVFVTMLGLCPSLAVTTHVVNAMGLGAVVLVVLALTSLTVSIAREVVPARARIPIFLAIVSVFVTIVDLLMRGYLPALSERLGIYVPLIVVNCVILARADAFARHTTPARALLDALGTGIGFLLSLTLIAFVRELLGAGTVTLVAAGSFDGVVRVPGLADRPVSVVGMGAGAFLVVGYLQALFRTTRERRGRRAAREENA